VVLPDALAFLDANHGLVAGQMASANGSPQPISAIQATADGGRTWQLVYRASGPIYSLTALGPDQAWAVVGHSYPGSSITMLQAPTGWQGPSHLLVSCDGGRSWHRLGQPMRGLAAVTFVSPRRGWAMQLKGATWTLLKTVDGGRTWQGMGHPCPVGTQGAAVWFVSPSRGWLLCTSEPGAGQQPRVLLQTSNGGRSWHIEAGTWPSGSGLASARGGLGAFGYPDSLFFLPDGHGWIGLNYVAICLASLNGGCSWHQAGGRLSTYQAGPLWFLNDSAGFAIAGGGAHRKLLKTTNGAHSWSVVSTW
jgi:photosystem II stability/assembly factor-like uncharacterized protein